MGFGNIGAGRSLLSFGSKHQLLIIHLTSVPGRRFSKPQHRQALDVTCYAIATSKMKE